MGLFLAVLGRDAQAAVSPERLDPWLPLPGARLREWRSRDGRAQLLQASWGGVLDQPWAPAGEDSAIAWEGVLGADDLATGGLVRVLRSSGAPALDAVPGSATAVVVGADELRAYCSGSGEYGIHVRVTDTAVLVSNRLAVLLGLTGYAELDPQHAMWLAVHGHGPGGSRTWRQVRQLRPGELMVARRRDGAAEVTWHDPDLGPYFAELRGTAASDRLDQALSRAQDSLATLDVDPGAWRLPLSGGKDSRAVLGLIAASGRLPDVGTVYTDGPPYSLDVLSAGAVARAAGISRHTVRRPPPVQPSGAVARRVLDTLFSTQGAISLFDTHGIGSTAWLTLSGHEHALRPSWWSGVPTDDIESFVAGVLERTPLVTQHLLTREAERVLREDYRQQFLGLVERGVPLSRLANAAYWATRISSWTPAIMGGNQYANAAVSPLMSGDLLTASFALPLAAVEAEVVHYRANLRSGLPIAAAPFANDRWLELLGEQLAQLGKGEPSPPQPTPYAPAKALGAMGRQHAPAGKQEILRTLGPALRDLAAAHADRLPLLDVTGAADAFDRTGRGEQVSPTDMVSLLGAGTVLLLAEYGLDLFDRRRRADVQADLSRRLAAPASSVVVDMEARLREALADRDDALAGLMEERRVLAAMVEAGRERAAGLAARVNTDEARLTAQEKEHEAAIVELRRRVRILERQVRRGPGLRAALAQEARRVLPHRARRVLARIHVRASRARGR